MIRAFLRSYRRMRARRERDALMAEISADIARCKAQHKSAARPRKRAASITTKQLRAGI